MNIVAEYPFNNGKIVVEQKYPKLLKEVKSIIDSIDSSVYKTKISKEKTMRGTRLFSPVRLNKAFKKKFNHLDWEPKRVKCDYPTEYYVKGYKPSILNAGAFREMDFIKEKLGVEIQFGKYAFMVYNVAAKMTIFRNLGHIDTGIEIVPVKKFANEMSSGVSYFEQFVWDLQQRGISNIDIPVLILGIDE
ncbi:MAG: BglII/BstYI family type II restriction endonuclease [Bacteroidota bacterium]